MALVNISFEPPTSSSSSAALLSHPKIKIPPHAAAMSITWANRCRRANGEKLVLANGEWVLPHVAILTICSANPRLASQVFNIMELTENIGEWLDFDDLKSLRQVNKRTKEIVESSMPLREALWLDPPATPQQTGIPQNAFNPNLSLLPKMETQYHWDWNSPCLKIGQVDPEDENNVIGVAVCLDYDELHKAPPAVLDMYLYPKSSVVRFVVENTLEEGMFDWDNIDVKMGNAPMRVVIEIGKGLLEAAHWQYRREIVEVYGVCGVDDGDERVWWSWKRFIRDDLMPYLLAPPVFHGAGSRMGGDDTL